MYMPSHPASKITRALTCLWLVLALSGSHWGLLQTAAWASMLGDYFSQTGDIKKAVGMTFDGEHPCGMCKSIEQGREKERAPDAPPPPSAGSQLIALSPTAPITAPRFNPALSILLDERALPATRDGSPPLLPPPIAG